MMIELTQRLAIAQPALSQSMAALEGEFDTKLFERHAPLVRRADEVLGPSIVREVGLRESTRRLVDETPFETSFDAPELGELTPALETTAYRIAQEATNNAVRHSEATELAVSLALGDDALVLLVRDDGVGLEPGAIQEGHGLRTMRERAQLLGGDVRIERVATGGTRVEARLPLARRA